ncbi:GTPase IMAP family member 4 [Engraulis encrasicolus]|uniref:GTPase IMAP family member 4 n=1 Tax=Engraulis encrasicolus TaxID=184585 RepID=UPI002FD25276
MPRRDNRSDAELRVVVIGSSGHSQFSLTNFILCREEFAREVSSSAASCKNLGQLAGQRLALVNGPNLYEEDLSKAKMKEELWRVKCLSAPGPHAFLLAFDLDRISPNDVKTPKLVAQHFGQKSLDYCMVLLAYEGNEDITRLHERVMRIDLHMAELLEHCGFRYHIVYTKRQLASHERRGQERELLRKVERMLSMQGGHHYTSQDYQRAEESVRKEERRLQKKRQPETERAWAEFQTQYKGEELRWKMDSYNASVRAELRVKAEMDNGLLRKTLAWGVGVGVLLGAVMGMVIGSVEGPGGLAVGGTMGAAMGGATGGAVQVAIKHLEERVGPRPGNFDPVFINRFFRAPRFSIRR